MKYFSRNPSKQRRCSRFHGAGLRSLMVGILLIPTSVVANEAERLAREGSRLFESGDFEAAAEAFQHALELAREEGEVPPELEYNLGTSLAKKGELEKAGPMLKALTENGAIERVEGLREDAIYNLGLVKGREALQAAQSGGELQREYQLLQDAARAFREATVLNPEDSSARHNYAVAYRRLKAIEQRLPPENKSSKPQSDGPSEDSGRAQQDSPSGTEGQQGEQESPSGSTGNSRPEGKDEASPPPEATDPSQGNDPSSADSRGRTERETKSQNPESSGMSSPDDPSNEAQTSADRDHEEPTPEEEEGRGSENERERNSRQQGGLERSPTPTPAAAPPRSSATEQAHHGSPDAGRENDPEGNSLSTGSPSKTELTPQQLDALRVLNSLEEGSPDQFKRLFQFRGKGNRRLERDW